MRISGCKTAERDAMQNVSNHVRIKLSDTQIAAYYSARVPDVKQTGAGWWRGAVSDPWRRARLLCG